MVSTESTRPAPRDIHTEYWRPLSAAEANVCLLLPPKVTRRQDESAKPIAKLGRRRRSGTLPSYREQSDVKSVEQNVKYDFSDGEVPDQLRMCL